MPEKELIYADLASPEKPIPPRRPIGRGRSISETEYADIDFDIKDPSSPKRIRRHSTEDFPPPPPDFFDQPTRRIEPHPAPHHKATDEAPPRPPRPIPPQRTDKFSPPDLYAEVKRAPSYRHQTKDVPQTPPSPTDPPPIPLRQYTSVFYPATPALKPPKTKPRDPLCNFVGLSDERDIKPRDPLLLQQYPLNNPVLPNPEFQYDKIYGLKKENIDLFLKCRDVAMILFYNPEDLHRKTGLKKRYVHAAGITSRYNHAYASVNCQQERELCDSHKITKTPVFSVFTLKNLAGSFRDATTEAETLKRYVENVPLIKRK